MKKQSLILWALITLFLANTGIVQAQNVLASPSSLVVQGTIVKTANNQVTIYGKPSGDINGLFSNIVVCVSIATLDCNSEPASVSFTTPIPHLEVNYIPKYCNGGRAFYAFNLTQNLNVAPVSWTANMDNVIGVVTFPVGTSSSIVQLNDEENGGGNGWISFYIEQQGQGDITSFTRFYGVGATATYVPTQDPIVLPIELLDFTAKVKTSDVFLTWSTGNEAGLHHFEIERSLTGKDFFVVGNVKQQEGNTYRFTDEAALSNDFILFYRLKTVDKEGSFSYSPIRQVIQNKAISIKVYPNPARESITIEGIETNDGWQAVMTDALGKVILSKQALTNYTELDTKQIPTGMYLLTIKSDYGQTISQHKVMIKQ